MNRVLLVSALVVAAVVLPPLVLPPFWITLLNYFVLSSLVALGLVLLTGIGGTTSFGQAAFVGIGAYSTAIITANYGLSPWIGFVGAIFVTIVCALAVGLTMLRLSGHYLPLGTLAWSVSLFYVFGTIPGLGGPAGLTGIPAIEIAGVSFAGGARFYNLSGIALVLAFLALANLLNSQPGRAIRLLPYGSVLSESLGINTRRYKLAVFMIAAILAAVSGFLYAHLQRFVNPTPFGVNASIEYLFMAVIGGVSSLWGALLGAGLLTLLKQVVPTVISLTGRIPENVDTILVGLISIFMLHRASIGLWPAISTLLPGLPRSTIRKFSEPAHSVVQSTERASGVILDIQSLSKHFGRLRAVDNVSFRIEAQKIVALLGPNGAGKSTLFNLLSGVTPPTSGHVMYRGSNITGLASRSIVALGVARTFQHVKLAPTMTVLENVAVGAYCRSPASILRSTLRLDAASEAHVLSQAAFHARSVGLGNLLERPAGGLSLGQQRLVEVARALASKPDMLLLDEPAAGLRHGEKAEFTKVLRRLREQGLTMLLVEHDMDFVMSLADRVVVMNFGQKIADGTPDEVKTNRAVIDAYLGVEEEFHDV